MKLPLLQIHILKTSTLNERLLQARAEAKNFSNSEIGNLLHDNARLHNFVKDIQRKWRKKGF